MLSACSGSSDSQDVDKVLDQTFSGKKRVDSGRLSVDLSAQLQGLPGVNGPLTLRVGGPFDGIQEKIKDTNQLPRADLELSASVAGQTFRAGATSTGDKLFVNFRGTDYAVPDTLFAQLKSQLEAGQAQADKSKDPDLGSLGVEPRGWLKDPSNEGTEDVGGTQTIHISSGVDVAAMLDDFDQLLKRAGELGLSEQQRRQLPREIPDSVKNQIVKSVKKAKLDLFTGKDDKILRRLEVGLTFDVPADLRQQANGLRSGDIDFSYQVTDINKPQTITAPASAKPLSELQRQFRSSGFGALGGGSSGSGGGGGGSSGTGSSGGGGGANSAQARRYLKCVQQASGRAELNRCADLLK